MHLKEKGVILTCQLLFFLPYLEKTSLIVLKNEGKLHKINTQNDRVF